MGKNSESLEMYMQTFVEKPTFDYENVVGQDSITRFDTKKGSKRSHKKNHPNNKRFSKSKNKISQQTRVKSEKNSINKFKDNDRN